MTRYLVLYRSTASAREQMANASPEATQAGMQAWMAWAERARDHIVDLGMPLGDGRHVEDGGATSPVQSAAGGYSILEADSLDAAAALLDGHPHFHTPGGASIDVFETLQPPGM